MIERIGFGKRLGAYIIDIVLVIVCGAVFGSFFGSLLGANITPPPEMQQFAAENADAAAMMEGMMSAAMGAAIGMVVVSVLYGLIEAFVAASPGKMVLSIKIGSPEGTPASPGALWLRYLSKNISVVLTLTAQLVGLSALMLLGNLLGFIVFIGCFFVLGANRQAFHDMIAKTAVYNKADLAAA